MGVNTDSDELGTNIEYLPTKCRITRPPPPKPATNPLQFIKVGPCPLNKNAQEQVKKAEEIKVIRQEVIEEAEDWQHNLDNWKSSRRKRQEHIIERVEEVKKLEQQEHERGRRRSSTFSEILEKRNRGRSFNIPIYDDDDSLDLSDYGIGSSSSKSNVRDVDTDDSSNFEDDHHNRYDIACSHPMSSSSSDGKEEVPITKPKILTPKPQIPISLKKDEASIKPSNSIENNNVEQYTYEGAIQDYRSRIRTKINVNESVFNKPSDQTKSKEFSTVQNLLPKGNICKRKEIFSAEKSVEINSYESNTSRRLSEDFVNSQSIKERLLSLEKCTDQSIKSVDKNELPAGTVKSQLQKFNKISDFDTKNNNNVKSEQLEKETKLASFYLLDKVNSNPRKGEKNYFDKNDYDSSAKDDFFVNKLGELDKDYSDNGLNSFMTSIYAPSTSSTDLMGLCSDREDSGIHTADVSCSVSQSDEAFEDTELNLNTIPKCIEKLNNEKLIEAEDEEVKLVISDSKEEETETVKSFENTNITELSESKFDVILTMSFLNSERTHSSECLEPEITKSVEHSSLVKHIEETIQEQEEDSNNKETLFKPPSPKPIPTEPKPVSTLDLSNYPIEYIGDDIFNPLAVPKLQPPSAKPPPLPPIEAETEVTNETIILKPVKRLNSTKKIKKELHIKRSSFLGLDEPTDDQIEPDVPVNKTPDVNTFLQLESRMGTNLILKNIQDRDIYENTRFGDSRNQLLDTGNEDKINNKVALKKEEVIAPLNMFVSDEDELRIKEQQIIEQIEKEEKTRDSDPVEQASVVKPLQNYKDNNTYNNRTLGSKQFDLPYFPETHDNLDDQDSEVRKVEYELLQLEREELKRQKENDLFREKSAKIKQNRHSYENICDVDFFTDNYDYRKSMPELQQIAPDFRNPSVFQNYKPIVTDPAPQYRKSMPDIQHAYNRQINQYCNNAVPYVDYRKSMPELQQVEERLVKPPAHQPIMPGKPIKPMGKQREKPSLIKPNALFSSKQPRSMTKHSLHALSAVPRSRHSDNLVRPKSNPEIKNYNQHWLFQEAELRRISEHQNSVAQNRHLPETNMPYYPLPTTNRNYVDKKSPLRTARPEPAAPKEPQTGHALPLSYNSPAMLDDRQDVMLSVSGKKKCSYCGNELGRGAAMIIESLCLFYHMECFKCCVCHVELGDGLMGTDVRVRNQKLHCHNCYSSDDGIKFSCV